MEIEKHVPMVNTRDAFTETAKTSPRREGKGVSANGGTIFCGNTAAAQSELQPCCTAQSSGNRSYSAHAAGPSNRFASRAAAVRTLVGM